MSSSGNVVTIPLEFTKWILSKLILKTSDYICVIYFICRGADDLLPILSYVIIKSKRTELLAEVHALEEFLYEG